MRMNTVVSRSESYGKACLICLMLSLIFNVAMIMMPTLHYNSCPGTAKVTAALSGSRNVLEPDGFVSNCITRKILGKVPPNLQTSSIYDAEITGVEKHEDRRQLFKEIFDVKVVYSNNSDYIGPIASG